MEINFINGWYDRVNDYTLISIIILEIVIFGIYFDYQDSTFIITLFNFALQIDF